MTDNITAQLTQVSEGLLFLSESEATFEVIDWKGDDKPFTPAQLLQLTGHSPNAPVQVGWLFSHYLLLRFPCTLPNTAGTNAFNLPMTRK